MDRAPTLLRLDYQLAQMMGHDTGHGARLSVAQMNDRAWIVVDDTKSKRLVASCPNKDAAMMIAALTNGNQKRQWRGGAP
jgi:hypothetical protein